MYNAIKFFSILISAFSCVESHAQNAAPSEPALRLLVPAYFYPAGQGAKEWDRLIAAAERVPIVAIVNPASGPGPKIDPAYVEVIRRAKKAKHIVLIGYVSTAYGKRTKADVCGDVDRWLQLYPDIQGIFFDEQASGGDKLAYYAELREHVRKQQKLKLIVTNPGTICDEKYFTQPATDVACLFEAPKAFDPATLPAWVTEKLSPRVAVLAYQIATAKNMEECIRATAEKKIGYCYVTDAKGANPWDRLPGYWAQEVALVKEINEKAARKRP